MCKLKLKFLIFHHAHVVKLYQIYLFPKETIDINIQSDYYRKKIQLYMQCINKKKDKDKFTIIKGGFIFLKIICEYSFLRNVGRQLRINQDHMGTYFRGSNYTSGMFMRCFHKFAMAVDYLEYHYMRKTTMYNWPGDEEDDDKDEDEDEFGPQKLSNCYLLDNKYAFTTDLAFICRYADH